MAAASQDDDYAADPVPDDRRIGWPMVFFAEMGIATALFFMQITSIIALRYGSRVTLIAIAYSSVASALIGFGVCRIAIRTGYGMNLLARRVLGYRGSFLFSLIFAVNSVVYFAAEATIMGASLKHFFPHVPLLIVLPAIALAVMPLVWFGMRILARLQLLTFILYAVILVVALYVSMTTGSNGQNWLDYRPVGAASTPTAIIAAIGTMNSVIFTGGILTADYARFVRRSDMRMGSLFVGIGFQAFCYAFSGMLGLWFSVRYLDTNPGSYFVTMLAGWGTVFAIATQLRINLSNMYSGSTALLNIFRQVANLEVSRHLMVLLFGVGTGAAMLFDLLSNLTVALSMIGMFVTCFTCLVLVDVYILRPIHPEEEGASLSQQLHGTDWRLPAIASLVLATTAGCLLQTGLFGLGVYSMAGILAALGQSVLYIVISRQQSLARRSAALEPQR